MKHKFFTDSEHRHEVIAIVVMILMALSVSFLIIAGKMADCISELVNILR